MILSLEARSCKYLGLATKRRLEVVGLKLCKVQEQRGCSVTLACLPSTSQPWASFEPPVLNLTVNHA